MTLALVGCGGSVEGSPGEDGSDGSDLRDATSDGDSTVPSFTDGGGADADATSPPPPPGPDGSDDATLDVGPDNYDGAFFPDGLCAPSTCLHGCCTDVGECVEPPGNAACGWSGSPCQVCDAGTCGGSVGCTVALSLCGPLNCGGCCIGTMSLGDAMPAMCFPGTSGEFCGSSGGGCFICKPGETCRPFVFDAGGFCQANSTTCDPTNCTGCCINGVCAQGDQAIACGLGGGACKDCGDGGICQVGNCTCGPPLGPPCTGDN